MDYFKNLSRKIKDRTAVVGIIGIGYVGTDLAVGSSSAGFKTIGFTRRESRASEVNECDTKNFTATTDDTRLSECDIICICVPTPIHPDKTPDLDPLDSALVKTLKKFTPGTLVIIESTIAPGTTRNFALPILEKSGLSPKDEFFLSFSPERIDPGNKKYTIFNTPKVISGLNTKSLNLAYAFYKTFIDKPYPVSSLEVAEMSKVLENTFRMVNISLSNELLDYTNSLGINLWEVINASATKPFGFLPHYPGPGIGGHCIPVDPYYLLADARQRGIHLKIIEAAGNVNCEQPKKVVEKIIDILKHTNGVKQEHKAMLIGITYKENFVDNRESPSLKIWELLQKENIKVSYHDPYVPKMYDTYSLELNESTIKNNDVIIITTPHAGIDYDLLVKSKKPILDTRNILYNYSLPNIYRI